MGEGLKRVAKQCGGLTAISGKTVIRYDADGNRRPTPLDEFLAESVREVEAARAKERDDARSGAGDEDDIVVEGQVTG